MERRFVTAVLAVSALLTASFLLIQQGSPALLVLGVPAGIAGLAGLALLGRAIALDARDPRR